MRVIKCREAWLGTPMSWSRDVHALAVDFCYGYSFLAAWLDGHKIRDFDLRCATEVFFQQVM